MQGQKIIFAAVAILCVGLYRADESRGQRITGEADGSWAMLGRDSCAAATCHGGPVGETIDWNSSLTAFETRDPHVNAGLVLENDLSRRIVETLHPESRDAPEAFQRVLRERCSGCHAPAMAAADAAESVSANAAIREGVSCEACHGPAGSWLEPHLQIDWQVGEGMRETAPFVQRVEGCVRCHVGSRQPGEMVRDMNHDMIAAGHPPLRFDAWAYLRHLPSHWNAHDPRDDGLPVDDPHSELRRFVLGRLIGVQAAVDLTGQRVRDAGRGLGKSVWPELADFDCFACHQQLHITNMQAPVSPGFPGYNPWLESGISDLLADTLSDQEVAQYQKRLDRIRLRSAKSSDVSEACIETSKLFDRPMEILASREALPPDLFVWHPFPGETHSQPASSTATPEADWHAAAFWFLRAQAYLAKRNDGTLVDLREELSEVHDLLRFRPLSPVPGVIAESPARFEPAEFTERLQRLKGAASPD